MAGKLHLNGAERHAGRSLRIVCPCVGAEIPPAGAPSGFDSAAFSIVLFVLTERCRSAQDDTEGYPKCEIYNLFPS